MMDILPDCDSIPTTTNKRKGGPSKKKSSATSSSGDKIPSNKASKSSSSKVETPSTSDLFSLLSSTSTSNPSAKDAGIVSATKREVLPACINIEEGIPRSPDAAEPLVDPSEAKVVHISNSPVKPDQNIWIEKLELYCTDKAILESSAKWLNDNIVCSAQNLLSKQSQGRIIGWQHTQCAKTAFSALPAKATFIQILHVSGCHWIMVSNVNPKGGAFHDSVGIYDSCHTRFGQSSIGSSLLEFSTGVQTVWESPIRGSGR